ncbi:MAG: type II toxin-antitoxin system prevent-host-death family antitoxin [Patescibacteria group bacterium]
MKASDVRSNWSQLLNKVFRGETEVLVEKSGIPIAAIVSAQDYQKLKQIKQQQEKDFAVIDRMRAAFKDQSSEQIQANVKKAIAEVRRENKLNKPSK